MCVLIELASTRLLHTAASSLPADVSSVLLASKRFLECSLCALEHACTESTGPHRAAALDIANRALSSILALTSSEAEPDVADLHAAVHAPRLGSDAGASGASAVPRYDEVLSSPSLQVAIARRHAADAAAAVDAAGADDAADADDAAAVAMATEATGTVGGRGGLIEALLTLTAFDEANCNSEMTAGAGQTGDPTPAPIAIVGAKPKPAAASGGAAAPASSPLPIWDQRVFARDVRRQNAETLLSAPTHGARRLAACCAHMVRQLLSTAAHSAPACARQSRSSRQPHARPIPTAARLLGRLLCLLLAWLLTRELLAHTHELSRIATPFAAPQLDAIELRTYLLHASGASAASATLNRDAASATLNAHVAKAMPLLGVTSAAVQLLLALPAASAARAGACRLALASLACSLARLLACSLASPAPHLTFRDLLPVATADRAG